MPPGVTIKIFPYAVCTRDAELGGPMPAEELVARQGRFVNPPKKYWPKGIRGGVPPRPSPQPTQGLSFTSARPDGAYSHRCAQPVINPP